VRNVGSWQTVPVDLSAPQPHACHTLYAVHSLTT